MAEGLGKCMLQIRICAVIHPRIVKRFENQLLTFIVTGWNDKIVALKKTTLQLYFKTFIEKINSGNLIM